MARLFIGIEMPPNVKTRILELQNELAQQIPEIKNVSKELLHLTTHFLGEVENSKIEDIEKCIDNVKADAFSAELFGVGLFPHVVYIGMQEGGEELGRIFHDLNAELDKIGVHVDQRHDFAPHLTIARFKRLEKGAMRALEAFRLKHKTWKCRFEVHSISLTESKLGSEKPIYTTLHKLEF